MRGKLFNVAHIARYLPARVWTSIAPSVRSVQTGQSLYSDAYRVNSG